MNTRNYYYRNIVKNLTGDDDGSEAKSDNYYLKKIYEHFGGTDDDGKKKSDNYYLRKTVELVTNTTINSKKPNNYYLKELYLYFGGAATAKRMSDFYYLKQIMILSENQPVQDISIELNTSNQIISQFYNEEAYLIAYVSSDGTPMADVDVEFFIDDELIETATTGQSGNAVLNYSAQAKGDITVFAKVNDTTSNEILIEDCYYFNSGNRNDLLVASGTSVSTKDKIITVTTSTSGEKKFIFPTNKSFLNSDNAMMELESARGDETGNIMGLGIHSSVNGTSSGYAGYWVDHWEAKLYTTTVNVLHSLEKGDIIRFVREDGYTKLYHNDDLIASDNRYVSGFKFGGYTNKDRIQRFKNVKVKKI